MIASQNGHTETVALLLQNGAQVNGAQINMQDNRLYSLLPEEKSLDCHLLAKQ